MAIFAKEAYRSDVSVTTLLALRFTLAAGAFWAIVATRRAGSGTSPGRRRAASSSSASPWAASGTPRSRAPSSAR